MSRNCSQSWPSWSRSGQAIWRDVLPFAASALLAAEANLRAQLLHQCVGDLEIGVDVLHVVVLAERLHQPQDLLALLVIDRDGALRLPHQGGLARLAEFRLHPLGHVAQRFRPAVAFLLAL